MIASYLRESTDKQDIETQRQLIQQECAKRNVAAQEFADDGVSGTIPFRNRPQARKLFAAAKRGEVNEVIVYRMDRLGRDHADTFTAIGDLLKLGVKVNSLKEGLAENTASGRLKTGIHTLFAAYERDTIVERSVDASRRLVAEGVFMGGITPYGFRQRPNPADKTARLMLATELIPGCELSEVDVLRRIYGWAEEGKSCIWIAGALKRLDVPTVYTRDGRKVQQKNTAGIWTSTRVRTLIINPIYKGVYVWGKRKIVHDDAGVKHLVVNPPDRWIETALSADLTIVSPELWGRAVAAVHRNQIAAMVHLGEDSNYLLRGLVRCSCGLVYYGMTSTRQPSGRKVVYYMHSRRSPRERCTTAAIRGDELEAAVWSDIEMFLAKPGAIIRQLEQQMEAESGQGRKVADEMREMENLLASQELKRKRAQDFLIDGTLARSDYDRQVLRVSETVSEIGKRLTELRKLAAEQDANADALGKARSLLENLQENARGKMTFEKRRAICEALVSGLSVKPVKGGQPEIKVTFRFEPHAQRYNKQWAGTDSFLPNDTDEHRCHKRRRCEF
jgi:site-specific DNA recombinase